MADLKNIVVKGCQFSLSKGTGNVSIVNDGPENDVLASGKEVYAGTMTVKVESFLSEVVTNGDGVGTGIISGTSVNTANSKPLILEGDNVTVTINGTAFYSEEDPEHPVVDSVNVKISSANQAEEKSN